MTPAYVLSVIQDTSSRIDNVRDPDDFTSVILRLEYLNRAIVNSGEFLDSVVSSIRQVLGILKDVMSHNQRTASETEVRRGRGIPAFDIREEQLLFLVDNGFKVSQISQLLGVSVRTVERRLSAFGIRMSGKEWGCCCQ